jgi:hypothetical protein
MLQLLLIALGLIVLLMGLSIVVKQELKLSGSSKLHGRNAAIAGAAVVAVGAVTVFYALVILPR